MARQSNTEQKKAAPQYEETLRKGAYSNSNRKQEDVKVAGPDRVPAARRAVFGAATNVDGSSFVTPLKKKKTSGGNK